MFQVEIGFSESSGINLVPTPSEFQRAMNELIMEAVKVVSVPERLLTHPELSPYTTAAESDGSREAGGGGGGNEVDVEGLVLKDSAFVEKMSHISSGLGDAFDEVVEFAEVFEPFKETFLANEVAKVDIVNEYADVDLRFVSLNFT